MHPAGKSSRRSMANTTSARGLASRRHEPEIAPQAAETDPLPALTDRDYAQLADFRATLRQLVRQTELEAQRVGLTPQHYHLLLAIKGFPGRDWANISELAERLQIRHNAVIGLIKRALARGLVARHQGEDRTDRRTVRVTLTPEGERVFTVLVTALREERQRVSEAVAALTSDEHTPTEPSTTPHP